MEGSITPGSKLSKPLLAWLALLPVLVLVFYPAFEGPFLLDDSTAIQGNSDIRHITVSNLIKLFRGHGNVRGFDHHPVSAMSAMIDYQWSGLDPFGFHLSNLIYHWLAAGAVLMLFLTIWRIRQQQQGLDANASPGFWIAASLMMVWSVHPFATMPVAYITGRQETMLCLFYMASMICLLRNWELASYILAIASFLCKEVAVTLPGALYLVDWARGGVGIIETFRQRWRYYLVLTTTWLLMCVYHLRGGRSHEIFAEGMPLATTPAYFKAQCSVIVGYLSKLFWPAKLQFYPYIRAVESWSDWVPGLVGLLIYIALSVYALRWSRWLAVAMIFPLLVLSPTSSVLPIPFEPAMEYRMYLPSVALIGLMLTALWRWAPRPWARFVPVILVFIPLAVVSHVRARDYETARKLYEHDIAIDPKSLTGLEGLSGIYLGEKRYELATATAWRLVDWAMAENNKDFASRGYNFLGLIESQQRHYPEAKDFFGRAIALNGNWGAKLNLATVLVDNYELEPAEKLLKEYLDYNPDNPDALLIYYEAKMSAKKPVEAEVIFERFMSYYPERHDMDNQRTRILNMKRRMAEGQTP